MPVLVTKRPTPIIVITGPDFEPLGGLDREPVTERRAYWREIAHEAYLLKLKELNKGIDVDGQQLTPRKKPRRDSATGPVLSPHWSGSRFESELQWHVRGDSEAVLTWKQPFARIVSYHAEPQGGHLPRRDVVGLTAQSQAKLKAHGDRWWTARVNKGRRGAAARTTLGGYQPVGQVVLRKEITHTRRVKPRPAHVAAPEIAGPKPAYKLVQDLGPIWEAAGLKRTTVQEIAETVRRLEATQSGPTLTELARRLGITRPIAGKPEAVRLIERNLKERLRSGPELPPPPAKRPPPPPVPAPKPAPPKIAFNEAGPVTAFARRELAETVAGLPNQVVQLLSKGKARLVLAGRMADHLTPTQLAEQPRGYPPGSTFANCAAVYRPVGEIVVCETYEEIGTGLVRVNNAIAYGLLHETGHFIDLTKKHHSTGRAFRDAYQADVRALSSTAGLGYYLQAGDAGPEEAFAEIFAQLVGAPKLGPDLVALFPRCERHIRKLLGLGKRK